VLSIFLRVGREISILVGLICFLAFGSNAQKPQSLDRRIPKADRQKYERVHDAKEWKNPFLVVCRDGIAIVGRVSDEHPIPVASISQELERLPDSAWPEAGIGGAPL
jgi:hypothetical protein